MADDIFDFGFTVVNEDELEVAQKATKTAATAVAGAKTTETKLNNLYNAIIPLLAYSFGQIMLESKKTPNYDIVDYKCVEWDLGYLGPSI